MSATSASERQAAAAAVGEAVRRDERLRDLATRRMRPTKKLRLAREIVMTHRYVLRRISVLRLPDLLALLRDGVQDGGASAALVAEQHVTAVRLGRAVMRALRHVPGDTRCLTQSLVLTALLARRGIGSSLFIAVAPGQEFKAHAWVEHGGVPLLPAQDVGFEALARL